MVFCTKLNSLRHVQKAHPNIDSSQTENFIKVGHFSSAEDDADSLCSDDGIPLYSDSMKWGVTLQPPAAHSVGHENLNGHVSPLSHLSPSTSPHMKTETDDRDTPLDFSIKQTSSEGNQHLDKKQGKEESPMDLSVKKVSNHIPIAPKVSRFFCHRIEHNICCTHCFSSSRHPLIH